MTDGVLDRFTKVAILRLVAKAMDIREVRASEPDVTRRPYGDVVMAMLEEAARIEVEKDPPLRSAAHIPPFDFSKMQLAPIKWDIKVPPAIPKPAHGIGVVDNETGNIKGTICKDGYEGTPALAPWEHTIRVVIIPEDEYKALISIKAVFQVSK